MEKPCPKQGGISLASSILLSRKLNKNGGFFLPSFFESKTQLDGLISSCVRLSLASRQEGNCNTRLKKLGLLRKSGCSSKVESGHMPMHSTITTINYHNSELNYNHKSRITYNLIMFFMLAKKPNISFWHNFKKYIYISGWDHLFLHSEFRTRILLNVCKGRT